MDIDNFSNYLPEDLWCTILMYCNYHDITKLYMMNAKIKEYCNKNNILQRRKYLGFPRLNNHCEAHDVSTIVSTIPNIEDLLTPYDYLDEEIDKILDDVLLICCDHNINLIYGDLICIAGLNNYQNEGVYIFNGCDIIRLNDKIDGYGALPEEFDIIDSVCINYWYNVNNLKGISHNHIVWLHLEKVRSQCLNNINLIDEMTFTTFKYNDIIYKIYYVYEGVGKEYDHNDGNKFKNVLSEEDIIPLKIRDTFNLLYNIPENTLFFDEDLFYYYKQNK